MPDGTGLSFRHPGSPAESVCRLAHYLPHLCPIAPPHGEVLMQIPERPRLTPQVSLGVSKVAGWWYQRNQERPRETAVVGGAPLLDFPRVRPILHAFPNCSSEARYPTRCLTQNRSSINSPVARRKPVNTPLGEQVPFCSAHFCPRRAPKAPRQSESVLRRGSAGLVPALAPSPPCSAKDIP